jgi:hypothetical protein
MYSYTVQHCECESIGRQATWTPPGPWRRRRRATDRGRSATLSCFSLDEYPSPFLASLAGPFHQALAVRRTYERELVHTRGAHDRLDTILPVAAYTIQVGLDLILGAVAEHVTQGAKALIKAEL